MVNPDDLTISNDSSGRSFPNALFDFLKLLVPLYHSIIKTYRKTVVNKLIEGAILVHRKKKKQRNRVWVTSKYQQDTR